jgi:hypothetical protein
MTAAAARAEAAVRAWMTERGYGCTALTARVDDPAQAPLGARGRRIAARNDAKGG